MMLMLKISFFLLNWPPPYGWANQYKMTYNKPYAMNRNCLLEVEILWVRFVFSLYEKNTLMTFSKGFRHSGHLVTDDAHFVHATTWPHGKNAVLYSLE